MISSDFNCKELRYCIKCCQKLGDSQVETIRKIQTAFGDDAKGVTQVKEWCNRFKDGRTSVDSETRSGRPSTSRNNLVIARVVMRDRRVAIRETAEEMGINTFRHILFWAKIWPWREWQGNSSHFIQNCMAKNQTPGVRQAPYSPDMTPCDFWLFPKFKRPLKGKLSQTGEDIMSTTTAELNTIQKFFFY